jgi:hypothetical protein
MIIKIFNKTLKKKKQGAPWEVKGLKCAPWWQKGTAPF